jgi:hypothetical protein
VPFHFALLSVLGKLATEADPSIPQDSNTAGYKKIFFQPALIKKVIRQLADDF